MKPGVFSEEVLEFRKLTNSFLTREFDAISLREEHTTHQEYDPSLWKELAALGVVGSLVPEALGGMGLSEDFLVLVLEESGYGCFNAPLVDTAWVAAPLLARFGSLEMREQWLPGIAAGESIVAVSIMGEDVASFGCEADLLLTEVEGRLRLYEPSEFDATPIGSMDPSLRLARIDANPAVGKLVGDGWNSLLEGRVRGAAGVAAILNGISSRLVEMSRLYALERHQFGRQIGSFQAVKHLIAEAALQVELSRASAWTAALMIARADDESAMAASVAKSAANAAASISGDHALQVHGGIGFTWEHDLQLWLKRAKALESSYGSSRHHENLLGSLALRSDSLVQEFGP